MRVEALTQASMVRIFNELEGEKGASFEGILKSITTDDGPEFTDHSRLEISILDPRSKRTTVYRAHPYRACERGTNENTNGIIHRFTPKGANTSKLPNEFL